MLTETIFAKEMFAEAFMLILVREKMLIMNILWKKKMWCFCNTEQIIVNLIFPFLNLGKNLIENWS